MNWPLKHPRIDGWSLQDRKVFIGITRPDPHTSLLEHTQTWPLPLWQFTFIFDLNGHRSELWRERLLIWPNIDDTNIKLPDEGPVHHSALLLCYSLDAKFLSLQRTQEHTGISNKTFRIMNWQVDIKVIYLTSSYPVKTSPVPHQIHHDIAHIVNTEGDNVFHLPGMSIIIIIKKTLYTKQSIHAHKGGIHIENTHRVSSPDTEIFPNFSAWKTQKTDS